MAEKEGKIVGSEGGGNGEEKGKTEGLPIESSPYTQYKDIEDYKKQGYGTEGHQQPQVGRGSGGTDAPTLSGGAPVSDISPTHRSLP